MSRRMMSGIVGVLLVAGAGGAVAIINAVSAGPAIHVAALTGSPDDIVIDPASGHAFIVLSPSHSQAQGGSLDRSIAVVDTRTGALLHTVDAGVGGDQQGLDLDTRAGRLVIAGNNQMTLLDTPRGDIVHAAGLPLSASSVAIDRRHDHIVVAGGGDQNPGDYGPHLTFLDTRTGLPLHKVPLNAAALIPNSLAIDDAANRIVVASTSLAFVSTPGQSAANVDTLKRVTVLDTAGRVLRTATVGLFPGTSSTGLLIALDRRRRRVLILDTDTSTVSILDEQTGLPIRATSLTPSSLGHGAINYSSNLETWAVDEHAGRLFVAMPPPVTCSAVHGCKQIGPGSLNTFDTQTGRMTYATSLPDTERLVVDPHDGRVLVTRSSPAGTTLSILDERTGRLLRTIGPSAWGQWASDPVVDTGRDRAYVCSTNGMLFVLDTRDGRVVRTLSLGMSYTQARDALDGRGHLISTSHTQVLLALDERAQRIVVAGSADAITPTDPWGWMPAWLRSRAAFIPPPPHPLPQSTVGKVATLDIPG